MAFLSLLLCGCFCVCSVRRVSGRGFARGASADGVRRSGALSRALLRASAPQPRQEMEKLYDIDDPPLVEETLGVSGAVDGRALYSLGAHRGTSDRSCQVGPSRADSAARHRAFEAMSSGLRGGAVGCVADARD